MPSKRLPSVAPVGRYAAILQIIHHHCGKAMELPSALYLGPSADLWRFPLVSSHSPTSVHPSGNPCKRSYSVGVRRRVIHRKIRWLIYATPDGCVSARIVGAVSPINMPSEQLAFPPVLYASLEKTTNSFALDSPVSKRFNVPQTSLSSHLGGSLLYSSDVTEMFHLLHLSQIHKIATHGKKKANITIPYAMPCMMHKIPVAIARCIIITTSTSTAPLQGTTTSTARLHSRFPDLPVQTVRQSRGPCGRRRETERGCRCPISA